MTTLSRPIKALGEVSVRVTDLEAMHKFYAEVLGLEVLRKEPDFIFYRLADGFNGHPQVLNLFDAGNRWMLESKSPELSAAHTTLHHIAFNIALEDYEAEKIHLEALGVEVHPATHAWLHVRSLYFSDPEGNLLELVAYDESVG